VLCPFFVTGGAKALNGVFSGILVTGCGAHGACAGLWISLETASSCAIAPPCPQFARIGRPFVLHMVTIILGLKSVLH
jgi:hypothetical protein